jgi:hypothetical protein
VRTDIGTDKVPGGRAASHHLIDGRPTESTAARYAREALLFAIFAAPYAPILAGERVLLSGVDPRTVSRSCRDAALDAPEASPGAGVGFHRMLGGGCGSAAFNRAISAHGRAPVFF